MRAFVGHQGPSQPTAAHEAVDRADGIALAVAEEKEEEAGTRGAQGKLGQAASEASAGMSLHAGAGDGGEGREGGELLDGDAIEFVGQPEVAEVKPVYGDLVEQLLVRRDEAHAELQVRTNRQCGASAQEQEVRWQRLPGVFADAVPFRVYVRVCVPLTCKLCPGGFAGR